MARTRHRHRTSIILLLACLSALGATAVDETVFLSGRLLGPWRHVGLAAHLELKVVADDVPAAPPAVPIGLPRRVVRLACLSADEGPARFKYAFPAESESDFPPHLENCTDADPAVKSILERLELSSEKLESGLCEGAARLLNYYAGSAKDIAKVSCAPLYDDGDSEDGTTSLAGVVLRGRLADEPVAAGLYITTTPPLSSSAPSPTRYYKEIAVPLDVSTTTAFYEARPWHGQEAGEDGEQDEEGLRGRRSLDHNANADDELQSCIKNGYEMAVPADKGGDVILVLGTTGAGKSTLVQFITDNNDLVSKEDPPGTDEYSIDDGGNKIGSGSHSKTTVPELFIDPTTGVKLYDFPGFTDSRGSCADIVTASILHSVARSANSVKFVFVISEHSVHIGRDRRGFVSLLRHATAFMKDVGKYVDSVALVVTKVPNIPAIGGWEPMPDEDVRVRVATFLQQVKDSLGKLRATGSDPDEFYPAASAVLDALLVRDADGAYPRIGLFRRPDEEGPLSEIEVLQVAKPLLRDMIFTTISAAEPEEHDFGVPLSPKSQLEVVKLSGKFAERLQGHIENIAQSLRKHYQVLRAPLLDLAAVREQSVRDVDHFDAALHHISAGHWAGTTPRYFLRGLLDAVREVHSQAPADSFLDSLEDLVMIEFLQDASLDELQYKPEQWAEPLRGVLRYLQGVQLWYALIGDLEEALSSERVQKDRDRYIRDIGLTPELPNRRSGRNSRAGKKSNGSSNGVEAVTETDKHDVGLHQMLDALKAVHLHEEKRAAIQQVELDDTMVWDLQLVLDDALRPGPLQSECEVVTDYFGTPDYHLVVRGRYVFTSEVLNYVRMGCPPNKLEAVHIVAEHTLFVDKNLELHHPDLRDIVAVPVVLTIVAPRWHVLGSLTVSVDGVDGAAISATNHLTGMDGVPGEPGGPAGSILALGAEFVNGHLLTLRASGGSGGRGQDGASGRPGMDGTDASITASTGTRRKDSFFLPPLIGSETDEEVGWKATEGQNGGNGGAGGLGGREGTIMLRELMEAGRHSSASFAMKLVAERGRDGVGGTGGTGGKGGKHGLNVVHKKKYFFLIEYSDEEVRRTAFGYAPRGQNGKDGTNDIGRKFPDSPPNVTCPHTHINRARRLAVSSLWSRTRSGLARRLLAQLDDASASLSPSGDADLCLTAALVHELDDLETARSQQHLRGTMVASRLLPRYESLEQRLKATAPQVSDSYSKVFLAARATAISSRHALRSPLRAKAVVNVKAFLANAVGAVRKLGEARRQVAVGEALADVGAAIEARARERRRLLNEHVQPALAAAVAQLRRSVGALPTELAREGRRVAESQRAVTNLQRRVREAKFRSRVVGLLTKAAQMIVTVVTGTGAEAAFTAGTDLVDLTKTPMIKDVTQTLHAISETVDNGIKLAQHVREVGRSVSTLAEDANTTDIQSFLNNIVEVVHDLEVLSGKGQQSVRTEGSEQNRMKMPPETAELQTANFVSGGQATAKTASMSAGKAGQSILSVREEDLGHREAWLRGAERVVDDSLFPILEAVEEDLRRLQTNKTGRSRTSAARSLRLRLRDVRVALSPLSSGLTVPREIQLCAELLDESLGALVANTEQLDELRERHEEAASMARVALLLFSESSVDLISLNRKIRPSVERLQETVRGNLVLQLYNDVLISFKQWVFPFAEEYLTAGSQLPTGSHTLSRNTAVNMAASGLENLLGHLESNHAVMHRHDAYIVSRNFSEPPGLYTWSQAEHADQLDRLLDGDEVALWADVQRSPVTFDSVKFDRISVRLVATNESRQQELDAALRDVHVTMTHMGDSYYKCGSKVLVLSLESQAIQFSFSRGPTGLPAVTNKVYDKLAGGDMMLSPFAMWKVRLAEPTEGVLPSALQAFKGNVRLVLVGHIQYVTGYTCSEALDEFYTFEPSKSELSSLVI